eukprot:449080_1
MSAEIVNDKVYIFGGQDLTISKNVELCDILKAPPSQHLSTTPSKHPSHIPSKDPSHIPSGTPSKHPSHIPSKDPSHIPSGEPSGTPVRHPTNNPFGTTTLTLFPSYLPTNNPNKAIFVYPPTIPVEESSSAPPTGLFDTRYGASQTMLYSNQDKPTDINHITTVSLVALIAVLCIASISAVFCLMRAKRQDGIKKTQKRMAVEIDVELAVNVAVKSGNIDEKDEREDVAHHQVITKTSDIRSNDSKQINNDNVESHEDEGGVNKDEGLKLTQEGAEDNDEMKETPIIMVNDKYTAKGPTTRGDAVDDC